MEDTGGNRNPGNTETPFLFQRKGVKRQAWRRMPDAGLPDLGKDCAVSERRLGYLASLSPAWAVHQDSFYKIKEKEKKKK